MKGRQCVFRRAVPLVSMSCGQAMALLGTERVPLIICFGEYRSAAADVVATFEHGGAAYFLVRLGLKAQTAHGFLVQTGERWRLRLRARDYPLLC